MFCLMISWLLLAHLLGLSAAVTQEVYPQISASSFLAASTEPSICVVVRTYWGHNGKGGNPSLKHLLRSLQRQSISKWEAVLIIMDSKPFMELAHILQDVNDDRIWVYAEWIGSNFSPRSNGEWSQGYHGLLYDLTDEAVFACSPNTRWVLVTNGDNEYSSSAFHELAQAGDADIVAFDFYSRYQRPTGPPCERFAQAHGLPACKLNKLKWCQTDLGANALNWPRLVRENRKFGLLREGAVLTADHFDGVMAETLVAAGWKVKHVSGTCLFEHSPSPQKCARDGGVWDDTASLDEGKLGGDCITPMAAAKLLARQSTVEELVIEVSNDGRMSDFTENGTAVSTSLRCLRKVDVAAAQFDLMKFFGPLCAADADAHLFENASPPADAEASTAQQVGLSNGRRSMQEGPLLGLSKPPKPPPRGSTKATTRRRYEPSLLHPA